MELLTKRRAGVHYSGPHVPVFLKMRKHRFDVKSIPLTPESIASYEVVLLATNHDSFDCSMIGMHGRLIVDTRGVFLSLLLNVVKA